MSAGRIDEDGLAAMTYGGDWNEWKGEAMLTPKHPIALIVEEVDEELTQEQAIARGRERLRLFRPAEWEVRFAIAGALLEEADDRFPELTEPGMNAERLARHLVLVEAAFGTADGVTLYYSGSPAAGGRKYAAYLSASGVVEWTDSWGATEAAP